MQKQDMMILGAAAVAVYLITRKPKTGGGSTFQMPFMPTSAPLQTQILSGMKYLPDASGLTAPIGTDWVVPGSQQDQMLAAQWP